MKTKKFDLYKFLKTRFTEDYIAKRVKGSEDVEEAKADWFDSTCDMLLKETGLEWRATKLRNEYFINPNDRIVAHRRPLSELVVQRVVNAAKRTAENGTTTYLKVSEDCGIALKDVMEIVAWLESKGWANRVKEGNGAGYSFGVK